MLKITGYPDRYSVAPGETIAFKISLEEGDGFDARLVRVRHGDCNPEGPGLKFPHVPTAIDGRHAGRPQRIDAGSYMQATSMPALGAQPFTFFAMLWPTLPSRGPQTIAAQWDPATQRGFRIQMLEGGRLAVIVGDGPGRLAEFALRDGMLVRQWYAIAVAIDPAGGRVMLSQRPVKPYAHVFDTGFEETSLALSLPSVEAPFMLAGCQQADGTVTEHFDGKIDGPALLAGFHAPEEHQALLLTPRPAALQAKIIAQWDFSREIGSTRAIDIGPSHHHGELFHLPTRGMKGWNWTGEAHDFNLKPEHYGAIHFHHDDLYDAGWETSVSLVIPEELKSGPYALHVTCGDSDETVTRENYIAFFVRPPRRRLKGSRPKLAMLAPTASYMAYANHGEHITARGAELAMNRLLTFGHSDVYLYEHPELGGSLYDCHADGSGVHYSSRLRPVLNFSPRYHSWLGGHGSALYQYNADTHLYDWLDFRDVDYDVITDEDLHEDGYELLRDYQVVITGTHPEYHSTRMWDAMKAWIDRGGRLMYMGGNGWYWRIAYHQSLPGVIELRRAEDGIRTWIAEPGEYYQSFNGEYGGLWRRIGRAPNVICGVGFIAQGFDVSSPYRRAPDADNPRAAFIFEGVPDEIIGDFGLIGGGAAGIELDCLATDLGSPPNMLRLASSVDHSPMMLLVNEEFGVVPPNIGGDVNPRVHADLAFGETPSGGALFATSSIAWCGSLSHNNYDNNVSRITWNVLKRFLEDEPFPVA
ncbi:N,N-dimethylformamidase [Labrys okinawensis]|uniref:N,N-dimethylformamidase n=1 Tax=Labrys okinawensis TaxID=346911 RepID=A0A2S9Q9U5_9HYPH|nr:N,N-dimethylformamidase beta subunit family domain-containing protein [Labrys okinawensis]PRH86115.1 N,N-dimethylformamidase [Labrys okinawensis]